MLRRLVALSISVVIVGAMVMSGCAKKKDADPAANTVPAEQQKMGKELLNKVPAPPK